MIKSNFKTLTFISFSTFVLFCFYFIFEIKTPEYFLCNELVNFNISIFDKNVEFRYPESCDQNFYYSGFENISEVLSSDFNYQERPVYILFIGIIYKIISTTFNIFNLNSLFTIQLSNIIGQVLITFINVILFQKNFRLNDKSKSTPYIISLIFILNPMTKWGVFDPSHQLLTMTALLFGVYFLKNKYDLNIYSGILFGVLMLLHRTFFIIYLSIILINFLASKKIFKTITLILFGLIPSFLMYILRYFSSGNSYDANTDYWGQFVWILDFIRGKIRFESEWHCVTIPENFYCYFSDNFATATYIALPATLALYLIFITGVRNLFKNKELKSLFSLTAFLYIFWSFIGWYPPIRFSYYSFGNLIILICAYLLLENLNKKRFSTIVMLISYSIYCLYLNHWNAPLIVEVNNQIIFSYLLLVFSITYDYWVKIKYNEKLKKNVF